MRFFPVLVVMPLAVMMWECSGKMEPRKNDARVGRVHAAYLVNLARLEKAVTGLEESFKRYGGPSPGRAAQQAFYEARQRYKEIEFLTEYYYPTAAELINGPALGRVEEDDPNRILVPPQGFQVIESYLFPTLQKANVGALLSDLDILRSRLRGEKHAGTG
ncbi:MAG: hypothetical protein ACREOO_28770 [bacterium]